MSNSTGGAGGSGGGGNGKKDDETTTGASINGDANTGSGGGGARNRLNEGDRGIPGSGGSGVVIIGIPTSNYSGTTTCSPTVTTSGSNTFLTYTGSGTLTT